MEVYHITDYEGKKTTRRTYAIYTRKSILGHFEHKGFGTIFKIQLFS